MSDLPSFEDRWLVDAGAEDFVPSSPSYIVDATPDSTLISIDDIKPLRRVPLFKQTPDFHPDGALTVDERVVRILRAFVDGDALPPVQVVSSSGGPPFELKDGAHRLHLSRKVGYTHVPAVVDHPQWPRDDKPSSP
jgi:hypothetical protein